MDSPKTGILILAVVAAVVLAGAMVGWQIRQQQPSPAGETQPRPLPAAPGR